MACTNENAQNIAALTAGRLRADAIDELLAHIDTCEPCSSELDDAAAVVATLEHDSRASPPLGWIAAAAAAILAISLAVVFATRSSSDVRVATLADLTPLPAPQSVLRGADAQASAEWERAIEAHKSGDYATAARSFEAAAADPDLSATALLYAGLGHAQTGELDAARRTLAAASASATDLVREQALWYLANAELAAENPSAARATLTRLIALDGDYALLASDVLEQLVGAGL
ncbi:MAG: hypothetical protein GY711_28880 [bacterium]|nr:hypothetical protein [bacterium]